MPPFTGARKQDYPVFRKRILNQFTQWRSSDEDKCTEILPYLTDTAFDFHSQLPEEVQNNWSELLKALDARYMGPDATEHHERVFYDMKWPGEQMEVADYHLKLSAAAELAWPDSKTDPLLNQQNKYNRLVNVHNKLWDSMPEDFRCSMIMFFNGKPKYSETQALIDKAQAMVKVEQEKRKEDQRWKLGTVNNLTTAPAPMVHPWCPAHGARTQQPGAHGT